MLPPRQRSSAGGVCLGRQALQHVRTRFEQEDVVGDQRQAGGTWLPGWMPCSRGGVRSFLPVRRTECRKGYTFQAQPTQCRCQESNALRVTLALALLAIPAVATSALPADPPNGGCLCPSGPTELLDQTDHIFVGDLIEVKGSGEDAGIAVIRVRENLKGQLNGVVEVRDVLATRCSWSVVRDGVGPGATSSSPISTRATSSRRPSVRRPSRSAAGRTGSSAPRLRPRSPARDRQARVTSAHRRRRPRPPGRVRRRARSRRRAAIARPR